MLRLVVVCPPRGLARLLSTQARIFEELIPLPPSLSEHLQTRSMMFPSPIQALAMPDIYQGKSLSIHSETGSGKTLAMLLPVMTQRYRRKQRGEDPGSLLVMAPTRELAAQLTHEIKLLMAACHDESPIALVINADRVRPAIIAQASTVVCTPMEFAAVLEKGQGAYDWLYNGVSTLILDEIDLMIPNRRFTGKQRWMRFMGLGMFPAEGIIQALTKRSTREDLQVISASATLDNATQTKLRRVLKHHEQLRPQLPLQVLRTEQEYRPGLPAHAAVVGSEVIG
jgi:superfamily II DNA/RNA helicase